MDSSEFIGMVMQDASPNELSDVIKQMLYTKSVEMVDELRPIIGAQMFDPTAEVPEDQDV